MKKEKIEISPQLRRLWITIRNAWARSFDAFNHSLEVLSDKEAEMMYGLVKHSLFRNTHAEILHEHPELREIIKTDDDRLCMHDIYSVLSFRLNKSEPLPKDIMLSKAFKSGIGRLMPEYSKRGT